MSIEGVETPQSAAYLDSFGEWLGQRRRALGLTRSELAACAGCSVSTLRKIEADERRPSRQLAALLAGCLRIPAEAQLAFLDAARGAGRVERLGAPVSAAGIPSARPTSNLPAPTTPLIGREAEMATLTRLLASPGCRLLTLVGPGGIGKTRLALEAACLQQEAFADGVFFASFAATGSPEFLPSVIAQAIGLNFSGPADPRAQLVNYLRNKALLLLLDNLEHLLEGAGLLVELLGRAPGVKLLVTSRERLELQGEWVFEVQGLPLPPDDQAEGAGDYSAVELFVRRAQRTSTNAEPAEADWPFIARICRLVEGMPLAIELAAAWTHLLSCREIAWELEQGLDILATALRDVPDRHRSMRAVFDHSWKLLSLAEKESLKRLSLFQGGFGRQAAREVAGATLPLLSALASKSLVRRAADGRYSLHELVRQYAAGRLAEDPEGEAAARGQHSVYYTDLAARLEGDLRGARQLEALAEMDMEIENVRAAWQWAVRQGQLAATRKPIRAFWSFYDIRGRFQEAEAGFGWAADELDRALIAKGQPDPAVQVLCSYTRAQQGWFCLRLGRFAEAQSLAQPCLSVLRAANANAELVDALQHAGALDRLMGGYARSRKAFQEMHCLALKSGDTWNAAIAEGNVGLAAGALGDYEEARERMGATVVAFRALGDERMLAVSLHFLGEIYCALQAYDDAQACLQESLALNRSIGDRWIQAMTLRVLGKVARASGSAAEAVSHFRESLALAREIGEHWNMLQALNGLGSATLALGEFAESRAAFSEALTMAWEMQALPELLEAVTGMSRWWMQQGSPEVAVEPICFVLNQPAATKQTKEAAHELWSEMEGGLTAAQIEVAQANVQHLSLEAIVESILSPIPTIAFRFD
jgi:predicted ATPase/transcriptional regulator with XRE-family HTH domain